MHQTRRLSRAHQTRRLSRAPRRRRPRSPRLARGPLYPCGKIPISADHTSSILALRTGEDDAGVIGLHQTGIPDEYRPSLNVRFMGITEEAVARYLVSAYFSAAVLVPDALGVLENVDIAAPRG